MCKLSFSMILQKTIFFFSFSSSGFVRISPRGLEIMKKKLNHKKTFSWSRKKVFSSPIHHEKNQKNEKTKKKLKYCSVDPIRLLFSNFPGKLNHFPKITRWQHGCHQCSSHQATTRRKTNIDVQRGIIYVLFSCPAPP